MDGQRVGRCERKLDTAEVDPRGWAFDLTEIDRVDEQGSQDLHTAESSLGLWRQPLPRQPRASKFWERPAVCSPSTVSRARRSTTSPKPSAFAVRACCTIS